MVEKIYNFNNPKIRLKANAKARISTRPKTYNSKKKREEEVKRELIKTELLKEGFLREIALSMDNIMSASIENATKQGPSSAQERKTLFQIVGLLEKDTFMVSRKSLADIVEEIEGEN